MCQNINSKKSTPDNIELACPGAKCVGGTCDCGKKCKKDPNSGICCNSIEIIRGDKFCVESFNGKMDLTYAPYL
jgi:hypothetical protein